MPVATNTSKTKSFSTLSRVERPKTSSARRCWRWSRCFSTLSRVERPKTARRWASTPTMTPVSVPSLGSNGRKRSRPLRRYPQRSGFSTLSRVERPKTGRELVREGRQFLFQYPLSGRTAENTPLALATLALVQFQYPLSGRTAENPKGMNGFWQMYQCFSTLSRVERPKTILSTSGAGWTRRRFSTLSRVERPKTSRPSRSAPSRQGVSVPSLGSNGRKRRRLLAYRRGRAPFQYPLSGRTAENVWIELRSAPVSTFQYPLSGRTAENLLENGDILFGDNVSVPSLGSNGRKPCRRYSSG